MQQKQFSPNPNLEHLKSQAKQLLKAYKKGSVDALPAYSFIFALNFLMPQTQKSLMLPSVCKTHNS